MINRVKSIIISDALPEIASIINVEEMHKHGERKTYII